jgi:hypothetical protein
VIEKRRRVGVSPLSLPKKKEKRRRGKEKEKRNNKQQKSTQIIKLIIH